MLEFSRTKVRIDKEFLEIYDELGTGKQSRKFNLSPLPIRKDVFMLAMTMGFLKGQEEEIPSGQSHDLFETTTFTKEDIACIIALYLAHNQMDIENYIEDDDREILDQAEKWAQAGLKWVRIKILMDSDQSNIYSLCDWIISDKV